jgi:hypothetical protein
MVALHPKNTRPRRKPFWIVYDEMEEFKELAREDREEDIRRPQGMQTIMKTQNKKGGLNYENPKSLPLQRFDGRIDSCPGRQRMWPDSGKDSQ